MRHFMRQSTSFHAIKHGKLRDDLPQIISPLITNPITAPNQPSNNSLHFKE